MKPAEKLHCTQIDARPGELLVGACVTFWGPTGMRKYDKHKASFDFSLFLDHNVDPVF